MTDALDRDVIRSFWADKAKDRSNRWTSMEMLEHEIALLAPMAAEARTVLDLGAGHGELSRRLLRPGALLLAVDVEPGFATMFDEPAHRFVVSSVADFIADEPHDLVLLFGVVTCLEQPEEETVYDRLRDAVAPGGTAVVKNQCAIDREFVVNAYSTALGRQYSGRYPNEDQQAERLRRRFARVEVQRYPERFNPWPNSRHVAFLCQEPRNA